MADEKKNDQRNVQETLPGEPGRTPGSAEGERDSLPEVERQSTEK